MLFWKTAKGRLQCALVIFLCSLLCGEVYAQATLRYYTMDNAESRPILEELIARFESRNPGIKIKVEPSSDEYVQKLLTQYAAGVAPDVAQLSLNHYQAFASRGALLSMTDFIQRTPQFQVDRYYPNVIRFFTFEEQLWALPTDVGPFGLIFYNKSLFDQAGLPYPDGSWTWDYVPRPELKEKCFTWVMQQLTQRDPNGKTEVFGFAPDYPQLWFYLLLRSRGYRLWDNDQNPTKITASSPEVVSLMEFASRATNEEKWIPTWDQIATVRQSSVYDEFVKGKIAMYMTFANYMERMRRDFSRAGLDWDVTLFPSFRGEPRRLGADGSGVVILKSTRFPEEAWKFAQWMAGEEVLTAFARAGLSQPSIRKLAQTPGVWLPDSSLSIERRKPANLAITDEAAMAMQYEQTPEYFEDTRIHLDNAAFDILSGTRPPKETLQRVTEEAQVRLDAARRRQSKSPFPVAAGMVAAGLIVAGGAWWIYGPERRIRFSRAQKQESRSAYLFLAPCLLGLLVFTVGPMIYSLLLSFSESDIIRPPMWRGLSNYTDAFTVDPIFWTSLKVTAIYTAVSVPLSVGFAMGIALLLNIRVRGMPLYRAIYYIPSLASGVATSLIWIRIFNPESGILNNLIYGPDGRRDLFGISSALSSLAGTPNEPVNWLGSEHTVLYAFIIMGLWGVGGGAVIFLAGLQNISKSYYEAAFLDGAGVWRRFRNVTAPLLTPTLFFSVITGIIGSFQVFTQAFVMTGGGPNNATQFYMLNLYNQGFRSLKMGYASALAWILFAIIMVFTLVQLKTAQKWVYYEGGEG